MWVVGGGVRVELCGLVVYVLLGCGKMVDGKGDVVVVVVGVEVLVGVGVGDGIEMEFMVWGYCFVFLVLGVLGL